MTDNVVARSRTISSRASNKMEKEYADRLDARYQILAEKALGLAMMYRSGSTIPAAYDLTDTSQGELDAAASGSLGLSPYVRDHCRKGIKAYYEARRERADKDARKGDA